MTKDKKEHILKALKKGVRYDGRKLLEYREVKVEPGFVHGAEGSAKVTIGDTEIIAGVKMALETPYPDTPDKGNLMVNAELRPMSNPEFESGPPGEQAIELSRVVDRGIRESKAIDQEKLCLEKGEKVWSVMIDLVPLNASGNLFDAGSLAAITALKNAVFPKLTEEGIINYDEKTKEKLPLQKEPIEVTVLKIGEFFIVDPLPEEEEQLDARLTVAITADNKICAVQKGGSEPLSITEIDTMVGIAQDKSKELRKKI
ncbi:exosome complex protein Rrp42 [Candidatus Woesearchaeota archaeon]|nr:exosome complex protein Rrp42 [Candidatus Woesearchaeota archaeon]MBW2978694.1 exosome complex protein Rrp42 [Candidatus Woesearchaeota archaeon]